MATWATIQTRLQGLLAPAVVLRLGAASGELDALPAQEQRLVDGAVAQRQAQFAAGRTLARDALIALGEASQPLLKHRDGSPMWPRGVCGSLTHTHDVAAAVVAHRHDFLSIGIDIEASRRFPLEATDTVLTPAEQLWADSDAMRLRVFCAKEAIYKCLAPLGWPDLDFRDVELHWQHDLFTATSTASAGCRPPQLVALRGRCARLGDHTAAFAFIAAPASG